VEHADLHPEKRAGATSRSTSTAAVDAAHAVADSACPGRRASDDNRGILMARRRPRTRSGVAGNARQRPRSHCFVAMRLSTSSEACSSGVSLSEGGQVPANRDNRSCLLAGDFLIDLSTGLVKGVSEDDARRRRASRVPHMCPACVRVFVAQRTSKCRFAGTLGKPSDGLEPSTPSLPWRFWGGIGGHATALAITFVLQIKPSARVASARACSR
jgi:hypothetical protein